MSLIFGDLIKSRRAAANTQTSVDAGGGMDLNSFDPDRLRVLEASGQFGWIDGFIETLGKAMENTRNVDARSSLEQIARQVPRVLSGRRRRVKATVRLASLDSKFDDAIQAGDAARDRGDWAGGEFKYFQALLCYPLHYGYIVQYAHCLKEQGKWIDAEVEYRNALALGENSADLIGHIKFVEAKRGASSSRATTDSIKAYWGDERRANIPLSVPPIKSDIIELFRIFLQQGAPSHEEIASIMQASPSVGKVIERLVEYPSFVTANRTLIGFLVETSWRK